MLDRLPDDVLKNIVAFNLPPHHPRTVPVRYKILHRYARICRSLARVTQQLLYKHLDLVYAGAATNFCQAVDDSPSARRVAFGTRTLRITSPPDEDAEECSLTPDDIEQVLKRIPGVREISIEGVRVDALSLSIAVDLHSLRLHRVFLFHQPILPSAPTSPAITWHLPNLTHLSLSLVFYLNPKYELQDLSFLLRPLALPNLTSLAMTWHAKSSAPLFGYLSAQLSHLWLKRRPAPMRQRRRSSGTSGSGADDDDAVEQIPPLPQRELAACSSRLLHLATDVWRQDDLAAFEALGSEALPVPGSAEGEGEEAGEADAESGVFLRSLRLQSPRYHTAAEHGLLREDPPCLVTLRSLLVEDISDLPEEIVVEQGEAREVTRAECAQRGIELEEREWGDEELTGSEQEREEAEWRAWCTLVDLDVEVEVAEEKVRFAEGGEEPGAVEDQRQGKDDEDEEEMLIIESVEQPEEDA
ncbi:hypothetical protein JCM11251_002901 [Rhodosporidiobolus azoricus]